MPSSPTTNPTASASGRRRSTPSLVRAELARVFRKRLDQVRVVVPYVGGGYGSKSYTKIEPLAATLSRLAGRPVRLALSVEEAMKTVRRHATRATIRTGVRADGVFVARECRVELDTGAYTDNGVRVTERAADRLPGPYRFEHLRSEAVGLFTNTTPAGSFRSIGGPQGAWACESHTDNIAHALGVDPLELRLKNLARPGEELLRGRRRLEADLAAPLAEVARGFGWHGYKPAPTAPHIKRGIGMACAVANAGASPISSAFVRLHADGSATAHVGTTEIGQGSRSALAQIAAEELWLPLSSVRVIASDTDAVPYDRSTGASRSTTLAGLAVHDAAADARAQVADAAARYFETFAEQVTLSEGSASFEGESASYGTLIRQVFGGAGGEIVGRSAITPNHPSGKLAEDPVFWEVSMGFAEVGSGHGDGARARPALHLRRRSRQGDQSRAGGGPGRGRGDARRGPHAVRGDALRGRPADEPEPDRLPCSHVRRPAGRIPHGVVGARRRPPAPTAPRASARGASSP